MGVINAPPIVEQSKRGLKRPGIGSFRDRIGVSPDASPVPLWVHAGALALIAVITGYLALGMWGWTYDDAYIIYRYARNLSSGLGMTYNPGEAYLGTSSTAYTLLLALLHVVLPAVSFIDLGSLVSTVGFAVSGILLWFMGVQSRSPMAGLLAAVATVANPLMVQSWGGEMPMLVPVVLASIVAYCNDRWVLTGGLLGVATLTRQDSLVLVGLIGLHYLFTRRRLPLKMILMFFAVMLPWLLYSWVFFGSPLPGTLEAKVAQGKAGWPFFLSGALQWIGDSLGPGRHRGLTLALIPLGAVALLWEAVRRRPVGPWFLVLGWAGLFTAGYTALRVSFYSWYAVPLSVGFGILVAWGVAALARMASAMTNQVSLWTPFRDRAAMGRGKIARQVAAGGAAILVMSLVLQPIFTWLRAFDDNFINTKRESDLYYRAGRWLAEHGGPNTSAAYLEVGEVGYWSNARIIDLLGLVTPGAASQVPAWNYGWAVQKYKPEYYLSLDVFEPLLRGIHQETWFKEAYTPVATLDDIIRNRSISRKMVIYRRNVGAIIPEPLRPVIVQRFNQQVMEVRPGAPTSEWPGQSIAVPENDLSAISLLISDPSEFITGTLTLHLKESPESTQYLRSSSASLGEIGNNIWHTFRFAPVEDSAGRTYFVSAEITGLPPGRAPLALWYATDELYEGGTRYVGTQPAPGDLTMRISVPDR